MWNALNKNVELCVKMGRAKKNTHENQSHSLQILFSVLCSSFLCDFFFRSSSFLHFCSVICVYGSNDVARQFWKSVSLKFIAWHIALMLTVAYAMKLRSPLFVWEMFFGYFTVNLREKKINHWIETNFKICDGDDAKSI